MENELTIYESKPLTANDIHAQVQLIQEVMKKVMKDKEHYGVIPGCGDKPALLKPGAEKLNLTFRMAPDPETEIIDLGGGHREYRVKCIMKAIESGRILGAGVGSATTMETKWRFRTGPVEFTGKPIPQDYWKDRNINLIGGKGFTAKKNPDTGQWEIAIQGEKVEHDNPADYYNTCWKMAKKRALVDAVLTVTAASDIFTQDIEEMVEDGTITPEKETVQMPKEKPPEQKTPPKETETIITSIDKVTQKDGRGGKENKPFTRYTIHIGDKGYSTFSKTMATDAKKAADMGLMVNLEYKNTTYGPEIVSLSFQEPPEPGSEG